MSVKRSEIYKCEICGNVAEVLHGGGPILVCCGKPMSLQAENTVDASLEKHVPVVEKTGSGVTVKVGSAPHPMEDAHYIEWIEVTAGDKTCRRFLKPGGKPEASFEVDSDEITVREYCNLHGLWKA